MYMSDKKVKTEYDWRGVDIKYGNRGPELTKKSTVHRTLKNESKKDDDEQSSLPSGVKLIDTTDSAGDGA